MGEQDINSLQYVTQPEEVSDSHPRDRASIPKLCVRSSHGIVAMRHGGCNGRTSEASLPSIVSFAGTACPAMATRAPVAHGICLSELAPAARRRCGRQVVS